MAICRPQTIRRAAFAVLLCSASPALAQEVADASAQDADTAVAPLPSSGAGEVYTPADFVRFSPRTALDMLKQVPGFSVDQGGRNSSQARGLGPATGNVLLNGERISSKSNSIEDQIARIPAENVIRIEMVDGASLQIPGLSGRVANIVAQSSGGLQGQFEWRPQLAAEYSRNRWLEGIVSLSGTSGRFGFTVALEGKPVRNGNAGNNRITFGNSTFEDRFSLTRSAGDDKRLSGSLRYQAAGGLVANLNSSYLQRRFHTEEDETTLVPAGSPAAIELVRSTNRGHDFEIGGDVEFGFGPGQLKLIALDSRASLNYGTQSTFDPDTGVAPTGVRFEQATQRGERIGRAEYGWNMLGADWQLSAEAAFNRLDQQGALFRLNAAGGLDPIPFPSGTGGVREDRYEASLSYSRPITDNLSMQLILSGEQSTIVQIGPNALARQFVRPKGSLSLSWTPEPGLDIATKIERRVGQLNFGDFLASVNLTDDNANGGNNELRPDQSIGGEIEAVKDIGRWGTLTSRVFFRRFSDYVVYLPLDAGGEARGNIPSARIMGINFGGTLRLDPMGLAGAKLDFRLEARDSRYIDPVTGSPLPIQFAQPHEIELDFRHDVPNSDWAYGVNFRDSGFNPYFRVAETGLDYAIPRNLQLFIEHKDVFGLTVQAKLGNILESEAVLDRQVYTGPRGSSPLLFSEYRVREVGKVWSFTVKGNF